MIKNAQFTDPRTHNFFFIRGSVEVHPDARLGDTPEVIPIGDTVGYPLAKVGLTDGSSVLRSTTGAYDKTFTLREGETLQGIEAGTESSKNDLRWNGEFATQPIAQAPEEERQHAARIFSSLTHMLVTADSMLFGTDSQLKALKELGFGSSQKRVILPISANMPTISPKNSDRKVKFAVDAFIDENDSLVTVREGYSKYLVDLCVANAHVRNPLELALLVSEIGHGATLLGLLSTYPEATSYLEFYAQRHEGAQKYLPQQEPYKRMQKIEFPEMTEEELELYRKLSRLTHWSGYKRRSELDWTFADKDTLGYRR